MRTTRKEIIRIEIRLHRGILKVKRWDLKNLVARLNSGGRGTKKESSEQLPWKYKQGREKPSYGGGKVTKIEMPGPIRLQNLLGILSIDLWLEVVKTVVFTKGSMKEFLFHKQFPGKMAGWNFFLANKIQRKCEGFDSVVVAWRFLAIKGLNWRNWRLDVV